MTADHGAHGIPVLRREIFQIWLTTVKRFWQPLQRGSIIRQMMAEVGVKEVKRIRKESVSSNNDKQLELWQ